VGVTYQNDQGHSCFLELVSTTDKDNWTALSVLAVLDTFHLTGDSAGLTSYTVVLQKVIDSHHAFLNGDMAFINAVLGLASCSATFGCACCLAPHTARTTRAQPRTPQQLQTDLFAMLSGGPDATQNHSQMHTPLVFIPADRIVPSPLHLLLGFAHYVFKAFTRLIGEAAMTILLARIKTQTDGGSIGASRVHSFNGPEIMRWIERRLSDEVAAIADKMQPADSSNTSTTGQDDSIVAPSDRVAILGEWLRDLSRNLLHADDWTDQQLSDFDCLVETIWDNWEPIAQLSVTPKIHHLQHAAEFARKWRVLGKHSEARIESSHSKANRAYKTAHINKTRQPQERSRRTLVSTTLPLIHAASKAAVQPGASSTFQFNQTVEPMTFLTQFLHPATEHD
jgi:hypothetical protein